MKKRSIFWGILFVLGGLFIVLNAIGIGTGFGVIHVLGTIVLVGISVMSFFDLNFFGGLIPLPFIAYIWRNELGIPDMNLWLLVLAAVAISIGLSAIFGRMIRDRFRKHFGERRWHSFREGPVPEFGRSTSSEDNADTISVDASFSEQIKYARSENLKRADVRVEFGSVKVYFDQCNPDPAGLVINVDCRFGSAVLFVPRTWNIDNQTNVFAGNVEGATLSSGDYQKVTLTGNVYFGDVKVVFI